MQIETLDKQKMTTQIKTSDKQKIPTRIEELTDGGGTNNLLEFISTYFPFIDEPIKLTYRGRTYKVLTAQARKIEFEDFFISFDCSKCRQRCCKNMIIPLGFEEAWPAERLAQFRTYKPRRYTVFLNERKLKFIIGRTGYRCKWMNGGLCKLWDSNQLNQIRPLGCIFFPMTWYWDDGTVIFTKYCEPHLCPVESICYTEQDFQHDINTFEKVLREVEVLGYAPNYRPLDLLKEQGYFTI